MSDTIYCRPGETFATQLDGAAPGLVGTVGVRILADLDGSTVTARTTAGITEAAMVPPDAELVRYLAELTAPADAGRFIVLWDTGEVGDETSATDVLIVAETLPVLDGPAYATVEDVEALNRGRPPFSASSLPNRSEVEGWLLETAGMLDGLLRQRGYIVPVPSTAATSALRTLRGFNAAGAAYFVERAAKTSDRRDEARAMWESAQKMLSGGAVELDLPIDVEETRPRGGYSSAPTPYFTRDMVL